MNSSVDKTIRRKVAKEYITKQGVSFGCGDYLCIQREMSGVRSTNVFICGEIVSYILHEESPTLWWIDRCRVHRLSSIAPFRVHRDHTLTSFFLSLSAC